MTLRRAYVGLGSNLDAPALQIEHASAMLLREPRVASLRLSRLFRSPPWGPVAQPDFVNAVAEVACSMSAPALLRLLLDTELRMGRARRERWGPRRIDLDLPWHEDGPFEAAGISVPHPRLAERAFVLLPWADLAPECAIPGQGRVADLLEGVDCAGVVPLP